MPQQLLCYQNIVPLDRAKHQNLDITLPLDLGFADKTIFIPILLTELNEVIQEMPIFFIEAGPDSYALVAVSGLRKDENLFVEGVKWSGRYIPAFLRRYPFITISNPGDSKQFTIAIDEDAQCFQSSTSKGSDKTVFPLFEGEGAGSKLKELLPFFRQFHQENQETFTFAKHLKEHDLLMKTDLSVQSRDGAKYQVNGVWIIDESKLKLLDSDAIYSMFTEGLLAKIYQIIFSMKNLSFLAERVRNRLVNSAAAKAKVGTTLKVEEQAEISLPSKKVAEVAPQKKTLTVPKKATPATEKAKSATVPAKPAAKKSVAKKK